MAWAERADLRRKSTKIFQDNQNPSHKRAEIYLHDVHFHDGVWQDVVEDLETSDLGGFTHMAKKMRHAIHFRGNSSRRWYPRRDVDDEYVEFGRLQYHDGSRWRNVNFPNGNSNNKKIGYKHDLFDLDFDVNWHKVKMGVVLKSEEAGHPIRWSITLNNLTWDDWTLRGKDDSVVGYIENPFAWDSNGSEDNPNINVDADYSNGYITYTPDLQNASYPVVIDPTLTLQPDATAGMDCYLRSDRPVTNYGTIANLMIGHSAGVTYRVLIKFDLSSLSDSAVISSCTLSLFCSAEVSDNNPTIKIYRSKRNWVESQATQSVYSTGNNWQSAGGFGEDDCEQTEIASRPFSYAETLNVFKDFAISGSTKSSIDNGNGWLIKADTEYLARYTFPGSDSAGVEYRPKLVIEYTDDGQLPITATVSKTLNNAGTDASSKVYIVGSVEQTLESISIDATSKVDVVGEASATLEDLVQSDITGAVLVKGILASTLESATVESSSTVSTHALVETILENSTLESSGNVFIVGQSEIVLSDATIEATAENSNTELLINVSTTLESAVSTMTVTVPVKADANIYLENSSVNGIATNPPENYAFEISQLRDSTVVGRFQLVYPELFANATATLEDSAINATGFVLPMIVSAMVVQTLENLRSEFTGRASIVGSASKSLRNATSFGRIVVPSRDIELANIDVILQLLLSKSLTVKSLIDNPVCVQSEMKENVSVPNYLIIETEIQREINKNVIIRI